MDFNPKRINQSGSSQKGMVAQRILPTCASGLRFIWNKGRPEAGCHTSRGHGRLAPMLPGGCVPCWAPVSLTQTLFHAHHTCFHHASISTNLGSVLAPMSLSTLIFACAMQQMSHGEFLRPPRMIMSKPQNNLVGSDRWNFFLAFAPPLQGYLGITFLPSHSPPPVFFPVSGVQPAVLLN